MQQLGCACLRCPAESARSERLHQQKARPRAPRSPAPRVPRNISARTIFIYLFIFSPPQLLSSISVIVPPTDSSYGNRDITADIAIHKNSSGWGPVARRAPLGKVIGQAAKGRESAEHVVLHPGDFTLLPLFSLSHAKLFFFFLPLSFFFFPLTIFTLKLLQRFLQRANELVVE